jgi:hypothetical membrane protein
MGKLYYRLGGFHRTLDIVMDTPSVAPSPRFDRDAAVTRSLLGYGVLVGPFYLAIGVAQGLLRDGFSFARHPLSVLANGDYGWVQTANFALSGLMVMAAAVGMARVAGRGARPAAWALGAFGAGVALAAIFRADPVDGFPPGTPLGPPTGITTMGLLHFVVSATAFISFGVSALLAARVLARRGESALSRLSLASGLVMLLGFVGGFALPSPVAGIWVAVVTGWGWLAVLSRYFYRVSPSPNCERAEALAHSANG